MKRPSIVIAALLLACSGYAQDLRSGEWPEDKVMFELIGQVKNTGTSSVQYGYLPYISGLSADQTFAPGSAQNETTANFTCGFGVQA